MNNKEMNDELVGLTTEFALLRARKNELRDKVRNLERNNSDLRKALVLMANELRRVCRREACSHYAMRQSCFGRNGGMCNYNNVDWLVAEFTKRGAR